MDIIRFIPWWWARLSTDGKVATALIISIGSMLIGVSLFGPIVFLFFLGALVGGLVLYAIKSFVCYMHRQYKHYQEHKAYEAARIVDRLKGGR